MNKFNNAKHAKSNLFLFPFIAIIIAALVALPFIAQALSQKAQAEPMSPADCEQASIRTNDVEAELMDCYEAFGHAYNNEYNFVMISEIIGGECLVSGDYYDSPARVLDTFDKNSTTHNTDILNNT
ncbi:MAG: hypothetical protein Q4F54_04710 [Coriobacteriia bacterium]|nr:hypothetical protein [Coriobacteriia bacterium]